MKYTHTLIYTTAIILAANICKAEAISNNSLNRIAKSFPKRIESIYDNNQLQGDFLIAVVDSKGLAFHFTLNKQGKDTENKLSTDTPFLIASHTKAFTGTLAQLLHSNNRFDVNAPINRYLSDVVRDQRIAKESLTVSQLLNHTAGFTSVLHTFKSAFLGYKDEDELTSALNYNTLVATAGKFRYSNTGPILAAKAIEKATHKSWKLLMKEQIFAPLSMNNTSSFIKDYANGSILPSIETDRNGQQVRSGLFKSDKTMHASGGLVTTLGDMAKWMKFNLVGNPKISKSNNIFDNLHKPLVQQQKTYFTYDRTGYSLAWDIGKYHNEQILTRFGSYAGMSFHASFMPQQQLAVVAFFNEDRGFVLPHLAANYIYNLVISPDQAELRFENEVAKFNSILVREQQHSVDSSDMITNSAKWKKMIGNYVAEDNAWPNIQLYENENIIWLSWGELDGPLYHVNKDGFKAIASLGALERQISIEFKNEEVVLTNGSIKYIKSPNS